MSPTYSSTPMINDPPPLLAVVDDNQDSAQTLVDLLESFNCNCDIHESAASVLKSFKDKKYSLIFLDLSMPGIDGIELMDQLCERQLRTPIVLISGHSISVLQAAQTIAEQKGLMLLGILSKPIRMVDILQLFSAEAAGCSGIEVTS